MTTTEARGQSPEARVDESHRCALVAPAAFASFPALERMHNGQPVAYFDGPGGTQVPRRVVDAMADYLYHHNANTHWSYPTSAETDAAIQEARVAVADFLNASPAEVVFGNNMTTITFHVARAFGRAWGPGDEVVVTELDHHANIAPWQALARERGITLRSVPFSVETGQLDWDALERAITPRTKLAGDRRGVECARHHHRRDRGRDAGPRGRRAGVRRRRALRRPWAHRRHGWRTATSWRARRTSSTGRTPASSMASSALLAQLDVPKLEPAPDEAPERLETGTQNHEGIVGTARPWTSSRRSGGARRAASGS